MVKTNKKQLTTNVSIGNWEKLDDIMNEDIIVLGNVLTKSLVLDLSLSLFFKQLNNGKSVEDIIGIIYGEGGVPGEY